MARAARMNSCCLMDRIWPRTIRATDIHEFSPMIRVMVKSVGLRNAARASSRKMVGMESSTSASRMMTASIIPA